MNEIECFIHDVTSYHILQKNFHKPLDTGSKEEYIDLAQLITITRKEIMSIFTDDYEDIVSYKDIVDEADYTDEEIAYDLEVSYRLAFDPDEYSLFV